MWKRLDGKIAFSEKLARLTWPALGVWTYLLPQTDSQGRYSADPRIVKARCMTLRDTVRLELVSESLDELERETLIHRYDSDGKRCLVLHDHADYNPPGAIRYLKAEWPAPPPSLCECTRAISGGLAPLVTSPSSSTSSSSGNGRGGGGGEGAAQGVGDPLAEHGPIIEPATQHLLGIAKKVTKMPNRRETLAEYLEAGRHRFGAQAVEAWLYDDGNKGKDVKAMQDELEKAKKQGERLF